MALKGLDIFKLSPKKNCKECGNPTCMAFCMKVAQGAAKLEACPYFSADAIAKLSEATAPPMKTITVGDFSLGGETVMFRHDKTFVSRTRYSVFICSGMEAAEVDRRIGLINHVDYERIGEQMYAEMVMLNYSHKNDAEVYYAMIEKVKPELKNRVVILNCDDAAVAEKALEAVKGLPVILNGADESNVDDMNKLATAAGAVLGVSASSLDALHDMIEKLEAAGNKNLIIDATADTLKETWANVVRIRRAALKGGDRVFGYPTIVNGHALAMNDSHKQEALAALFTVRYGSIFVMDEMDYAKALPLYGLRQNIFTDPQKPMKVQPGIYPINHGDENSVCLTTVDFALTYFVVSGELERSGVPCNLLISDAGGYSVLTSWAAGKFSASSIAKFIEEFEIPTKIKNRKLIIPGKVAVLKGELESKLPDWEIIVAPNEAVQLVKFLRDMNK